MAIAIRQDTRLAKVKIVDAETGEDIGKIYEVKLVLHHAHTMAVEVSAHLTKAGAELLRDELNEVST